ncbi:hypothetical protein P4S91_16610 [Aneurinibacillus aneurinilyticus]|jgi:hypothetical protein|uniref:Uncharacterized protein n=1 Tax=Aneurinibacillus aneurinilyticus TaxID=1391 RepID=A0A848CSB5_ANEAE|nr:hypothetical protein [Aneurinibacillus aneurinilyticus]MCI1694554.1 hypothetical protein [Aneurinibacillus aneurinilyticus]MED0670919.1 hypothetical protein [Aneurinibacillus aneurinilyticus]MED0724520.1 hypothetical protein [Aneurinibacillus aneurinilyticus]MED0731355.1 hypothetical protein [Aneurinibacillus aneurinilyticus]MED0739389.1 hypothetical protein [Aneurinibacillus aneurinilyticus]
MNWVFELLPLIMLEEGISRPLRQDKSMQNPRYEHSGFFDKRNADM